MLRKFPGSVGQHAGGGGGSLDLGRCRYHFSTVKRAYVAWKEEGIWTVHAPAVPGVYGMGNTLRAAKRDLAAALSDLVEYLRDLALVAELHRRRMSSDALSGAEVSDLLKIDPGEEAAWRAKALRQVRQSRTRRQRAVLPKPSDEPFDAIAAEVLRDHEAILAELAKR